MNDEVDYVQLRKIATAIYHLIEITVRSNNGARAAAGIGTCLLNEMNSRDGPHSANPPSARVSVPSDTNFAISSGCIFQRHSSREISHSPS